LKADLGVNFTVSATFSPTTSVSLANDELANESAAIVGVGNTNASSIFAPPAVSVAIRMGVVGVADVGLVASLIRNLMRVPAGHGVLPRIPVHHSSITRTTVVPTVFFV